MRNNIFIKSMLRQRVRTAILVLLVTAAAFAFVMRAVEYIVVTDKIDGISKYYRSVGFLQYTGDQYGYGNVIDGADIVRGSPYLAFEDRRRGAEGIVAGMMNSHVEGMNSTSPGASYRWHNNSNADAFFYAELIGMERLPHSSPPCAEMAFRVDSVLLGYPEHVVEGQEIKMRYYLTEDEKTVLGVSLKEQGEATFPETPIDDMAVGQRYFLRGAYHGSLSQGLPRVGDSLGSTLTMHPLNEKITLDHSPRAVLTDPLWYVPVAPGEHAGSSVPGLEDLDEELMLLRHHQSSVQIRTTADMTAMPLQMQFESWILRSGRWIGPEDYFNESRVAMVHWRFADIRGLEIGDTLTVSIPREQRIIETYSVSAGASSAGFIDLIYAATPEERPAHELELEIVGVYGLSFDDRTGVLTTMCETIIYIPDSVLPHDLEHSIADTDPLISSPFGNPPQQILRDDTRDLPEYLPSTWYSFALSDPKDEKAFLAENRDALAELGYAAWFFEHGAENFWASATPILRAVTFNAIAFCAVLVLVLALAQFLYLRQRRKDFAIMRALGSPKRGVFARLMVSVLFFGLPATALGGAAGWFFALDQAGRTLNPFGEIVTARDFTPEFYISALWFPSLVAIALAALLALAAIGARRISRCPVLELLQGPVATGAARSYTKGRDKSVGAGQTEPIPRATGEFSPVEWKIGSLPEFSNIGATGKSKTQAALRYVLRHILRNAAKSALAAAVALLFVLALAWLRESIRLSESEIERLYNTVIVNAEVVPRSPGNSVTFQELGQIIRRDTVYGIADSVYAQDVYIEAGYQYAMIIPADDDGAPAENWDALVGYDDRSDIWANIDCYNPVLAFNDTDMFIQQHSRRFSDEIPGSSITFDDGTRIGELHIEFSGGYDESSFVYAEGEPVPVILSGHVMERWGLGVGDAAYINLADDPYTLVVAKSGWTQLPVVVVGTHNRNLRGSGRPVRDAILAPLAFVEDFMGKSAAYIRLSFNVDPSMTREIDAIKSELGEIAGRFNAGWVPLRLQIQDEELRTVVGSVEQNLALLTLLYPVAVGLSVAIGLGLSMLLMLQNAKNAAIMRVLGATKKRSAAVLCAEKLFVCMFGLAIGLSALMFIGWNLASSALLALLYLAGATAGAAIGSVMVTNRPPLELLQVRE